MTVINIVLGYFQYLWHWIVENAFYINILFGFAVVFMQRKKPTSVWAWLLVLYFIPLLGFFLYLAIGYNYLKKRMFRTKEIEDKLNAEIKKQGEIIRRQETPIDAEYQDYKDMILYNLEYAQSIYTTDNDVTIFTDGNDKFNDLMKEIRNAKEYIHMQYYIISKGELFDRIFHELEKKVEEGVEVRIMYDGMGGRDIGERNYYKLKHSKIKFGVFFPPVLGRFNLRFNYRNHRKIVVIDGKIGYVGGFNVGDEYIDKNKKFGHWRDTHLKITGTAVTELQIRFVLDWNYATGENLFQEDKYFKSHFSGRGNKVGMQIVSSGPDSKREEIRNNYIRMITKAKKSIYIQTPYFIPDEPMIQALEMAAMSGIDVRIMIPCKPDHPFVYWTTYSYAGELLEYGAKVYCYDNGFLHAKGLIVDGIVCSYGTANMDIRSFELNFEVNAVIYNRRISQQLEQIFLNDLNKCSELTKYDYDRRSLIIRFKEQISRLLSPLL